MRLSTQGSARTDVASSVAITFPTIEALSRVALLIGEYVCLAVCRFVRCLARASNKAPGSIFVVVALRGAIAVPSLAVLTSVIQSVLRPHLGGKAAPSVLPILAVRRVGLLVVALLIGPHVRLAVCRFVRCLARASGKTPGSICVVG